MIGNRESMGMLMFAGYRISAKPSGLVFRDSVWYGEGDVSKQETRQEDQSARTEAQFSTYRACAYCSN